LRLYVRPKDFVKCPCNGFNC